MQRTVSNSSSVAATLSVYGAAHLVVDAVCAAAVLQTAAAQTVEPDVFLAWLLLYHALAFSLQPLIGLALDVTRRYRTAAVAGCLASVAALLVPSLPMLAVIVAGVGNAAFHVGAGVPCLWTMPHRATAPGLFVAPGSLGLLIGVLLGKQGTTACIPLLPAALAACLLMARRPVVDGPPTVKEDSPIFVDAKIGTAPPPRLQTAALIGPGEFFLGLILLSIAVRALLGFLVGFRWETQPGLLIALTLAVVAGKVLGGVLADRWGWLRVGVGSLLAALPFLACGATHSVAALPGVLLLNFTMPVTLAATVEALPGYPGFAFGLTCLALLFGTIPAMLGVPLGGPFIVCAVILLSAAALYRGLRMLPAARSGGELEGV